VETREESVVGLGRQGKVQRASIAALPSRAQVIARRRRNNDGLKLINQFRPTAVWHAGAIDSSRVGVGRGNRERGGELSRKTLVAIADLATEGL
jgi:hypothetical protein